MEIKKKTIGTLPSISIIVGSVLGTGIFFAPSMVAKFSTNIWVVTGLWGLGALLCLLGADIYGRLGRHIPEGGGQYVYLKKGINESVASVYGWLSLVVLCPTMIAGMCLYLSSHLSYVIEGPSESAVKLCAILFATFLTFLNYRGIRAAGRLQTWLVALQIFVILAMTTALFFFSNQPVIALSEGQGSLITGNSVGTFSAGLLAFAAILWSFEGFNTLTFVTDEVKSGKFQVRKCLLIGTGIVFILYLLINLCAVLFVSADQIAQNPNVAILLNEMGFGVFGKNVTLLLTLVGLITTGHAAVLIGPRITAQLAKDRRVPARYSRLCKKTTSPNNALTLQLVLTSAFIIFGNFEGLVTTFVVVNWFFYVLVALSLLNILPKKERTPLVVSSVTIFSVLIISFIVAQIYQNPTLSFIGMGVVAGLILVTNYFLKRDPLSPALPLSQSILKFAKKINLL